MYKNTMFSIPQSSNGDNIDQNGEHHSLDSSTPALREVESNESIATITVQPFTSVTRRPIPIATIDWQSTPNSQMIAGQGIDFLGGVEQLYIQQTVELCDLMTNIESENRYTVKVPHGETLFYASEASSDNQRMFCGSNRAFCMRLFDHTQQEALCFKRGLGCSGFSLSFCRHNMEIFLPGDELIGYIKQEFSFSVPSFSVYNHLGSILYKIEGPASWGCFMSSKESHFKIYSGDGMTQLGSVNHVWDQINSAYTLALQFPSRRDDTRNKSLLLGAAFLLEYMYFVMAKKAGCC